MPWPVVHFISDSVLVQRKYERFFLEVMHKGNGNILQLPIKKALFGFICSQDVCLAMRLSVRNLYYLFLLACTTRVAWCDIRFATLDLHLDGFSSEMFATIIYISLKEIYESIHCLTLSSVAIACCSSTRTRRLAPCTTSCLSISGFPNELVRHVFKLLSKRC